MSEENVPTRYESISRVDDQNNFSNINDKNSSKTGKKEIVIPARSEVIVELPIKSNRTSVCTKQEIKPGIYLGDCIVHPNEGHAKVSILNINKEDVKLYPDNITPTWTNLDQYEVIHADYHKDPVVGRLSELQKLIKLDHCNNEERDSITKICRNYNDLFYLEGDHLTCTDVLKHTIPTLMDKPPIYTKPYRLPEAQRNEINKQINQMLENGIISPSSSPWNSPLLLVPKKPDANGNKKWRVVVDFRRVNEITIGDAYPLPNITDILDQLGKSKYFTTLDLANGFHQIPLEEADKEKTAFSTPFGHYHYNRMPFGLKTAPATFQRLMNTVLAGLQGIRCFVYLDDIVVYGYDLRDHNTKLMDVFDRLREANLKLQPEKCHFLGKEITYLGHVVSSEGVHPDPTKIEAVKTYPQPKKAKDVKAFLGFVGYYRRFIPSFAKIAKPLTKLLKSNIKPCRN